MATSNVAIAKRALQLLGATTISALDQNTKNAREMNTAFIPRRDALLRKYDWNFAIKRRALPALATQDIIQSYNQFELPNDYVRLLKDDETGDQTTKRKDWQIEGRVIITADAAPLNIRYLAQITDPQQFDPSFDELLAYDLALNTARAITGSSSIIKELQEGKKDALNDARQANAFENESRKPPEDDWLAAMR